MTTASPRVFCIGYQGKSIGDLCEKLKEAGVSTLVDVRERAWSQRPAFRKGALRDALKEAGIGYVHCQVAGNPFRPRNGELASVEECAEKYRGYLEGTPAAISAVRKLVVGQSIALFCYEHLHTHCHRGVLIDVLSSEVPGLLHVPLK